MNTSLWVESYPNELNSELGVQLENDIDCDVAIVGGGYTGLWTAFYLHGIDPSLKVAILEAEYIGFGASGRNGGWASALFPQQLSALARKTSPDQARAMHKAMTSNVAVMGSVISEQGWDVDWSHAGTVVAARTPLQFDRARSEVDDMAAWGFHDDLILLDAHDTRKKMNATDTIGGTFTPHCAALHPYKLVRSLGITVKKHGTRIYERTAVAGIEPGLVRTVNGPVVRAPIIVRATEGYTRTLHNHDRTLAPVYSMMLATEPLPSSVWEEIGLSNRETFSDFRNLIIYGQRTADDRLAFGGRGAPYHFGSRISPEQDQNQSVHQGLWRVLTDLFPSIRETRVTHTWGGPLGIARDWWASCGFDPKTGLAWSGGYVGDGVGTSHLGGKTLAHLITGVETELTQLPWVNHHSRAWEPEPLRWLGANLGLRVMQISDNFENRTGRHARVAGYMNKLVGH